MTTHCPNCRNVWQARYEGEACSWCGGHGERLDRVARDRPGREASMVLEGDPADVTHPNIGVSGSPALREVR